MNQFIKKTLIFIFIPVIITLLGLVYLNYSIEKKHTVKSNISTVFIGDSHIQLAINDSVIPKSKNIANSSESFYFSYYKLKLLLENNNSIKRVYLGVSFHSLSNYYDKFINGDYSSSISPKYFFKLTPIEQARLIYWNKKNFCSFMREVIKSGILQIYNKNYAHLNEGYSNQFRETLAVDSSMDKRLLFQYYDNNKLNSFSEINIHYLNKIIALCKKTDVHLIIINTPLHSYYYKKIPKEYKEKLTEIIKINQLDYVDLSNLELSDNCFIPDGDHLSSLGAEKISVKIKEIEHERTTKGLPQGWQTE